MSSTRLAFVTSNPHKVAEARLVLSSYGIEIVQVPAEKIELQSRDIARISLLAAKLAYARVRKPLIVEDSGLFIDSLRGFPGPFSSYAYETIGVEGVLKLMKGVADRRANFVSAVALLSPPIEKVFIGTVRGTIASEARGSSGFGFDPIFVPEGDTRTFAEMSIEEKCAVSHRAAALRLMAEWLKKRTSQS
ncbi:MAG: XTP/dITP diphosphatase [Fervidicoccaceae archaeon]